MSQYRAGQILDITITALALGGKAIGRHEGCVLFINQGLPGQHVRVRITSAKKRFAEAELLEVLTHNGEERAAFCPHFGVCGGCTWQHLPYDQQLIWKERFLHDTITRIGGQSNAQILPIIASPHEIGFRNKMEFAFATHEDGSFHLGLRQRASHQIVDVTNCVLQSPLANSIVQKARELCQESSLPAWNDATHEGFWRFLLIRKPHSGKQCVVHCITGFHPKGEEAIRHVASELMQAIPQITGFSHAYRQDSEQVAQGKTSSIAYGTTTLTETLGALSLQYPADSFFQTNTLATELLYTEVSRMAGLTGKEHVWDVYCGVGSIALWLAPQASHVLGIEASAQSIAWAKSNATKNTATPCTFEAGDARHLLTKRRPKPDVVVVDPPRAGLHPSVIKTLCQKHPARIVYVSCNPATLARDLKLFAEHYALIEARPVDLFPQTAHVEAVALLKKIKKQAYTMQKTPSD